MGSIIIVAVITGIILEVLWIMEWKKEKGTEIDIATGSLIAFIGVPIASLLVSAFICITFAVLGFWIIPLSIIMVSILMYVYQDEIKDLKTRITRKKEDI